MKKPKLFERIYRRLYLVFMSYTLMIKTSIYWRLGLYKNPKKHRLDKQLIVSLTSYKLRFSTLHLTLKCLLNQTYKPDRIILWIDEVDIKHIPNNILQLKAHGIEVLVSPEFKSYKKIIPTLELGKDVYIITVDDDLYYPPNLIERLVECSIQSPGVVIANRTHHITLNEEGLPKPYNMWAWENCNNQNLDLNFLTGVGGVLYPPNIFFEDILKDNLFRKLAPNADDVWLYWMVRLNNRHVKFSGKTTQIINWPGSQKTALCFSNVDESANDLQIQKMIEYYGFPNAK